MNSKDDTLSVSILLPVLFRESSVENISLLARALDSIHIQEFPSDYEILLIDDGSATEIASLAPVLGNDRLRNVRFIRLVRNGGLVNALNRGLMEARHTWIARLDADDVWLGTKIKKQFSLIAADSDATITATGMTLVDPSGEAIETHVRPGDWHGILRFFIDVGCPFPHGSVLAQRDIYRMLGGYTHDPAFSHCEDYALWGVWLRFFKPRMIEEALYNYTVSINSVSGVHGEQQRSASRRVNQTFIDLNLFDTLPQLLFDLSGQLGCSITEAGILAYKMWRFGPVVRLPADAYSLIEAILPDRRLIPDRRDRPVWDVSDIIGNPSHADNAGSFIEVRAL